MLDFLINFFLTILIIHGGGRKVNTFFEKNQNFLKKVLPFPYPTSNAHGIVKITVQANSSGDIFFRHKTLDVGH